MGGVEGRYIYLNVTIPKKKENKEKKSIKTKKVGQVGTALLNITCRMEFCY